MWSRLKLITKRFSTMEFNARYSRLAGDISSFEPQLEKRIMDTNSNTKQWAIKSRELLEQSKKYLQEFKIDEGWKCLHTAKRYEVFGMDRHERIALAQSLCKEAQKLNEWRKDAILDMLQNKKGKVSNAPEPDVLVRAAELKDEDYNNQYYLNRLAHNLFWTLSCLMFLILFLIVVYFTILNQIYGCDYSDHINLVWYIIGVLLFGLLGANTSAILFTRTLSKSSRIKEIVSSQVVVLSKIFIGAGFSVFIFLFLRSSISSSINLFSFSVSTPIDYFAIAFVSGFTERLAQKSIDLITGKDKPEKGKTSGPAVV